MLLAIDDGMWSKMKTVMMCLLFLALGGPPDAVPDKPAIPSLDVQLEDVLTEWDWKHEVRLGRVAIESRVFKFCAGGRVHEQIWDDTGRHDYEGTWALERITDGYLLTLAGEHLRDRGRFVTTYSESEKALYLRIESGNMALKFQAKRGSRPSPCATSDDGVHPTPRE